MSLKFYEAILQNSRTRLHGPVALFLQGGSAQLQRVASPALLFSTASLHVLRMSLRALAMSLYTFRVSLHDSRMIPIVQSQPLKILVKLDK
jgi:hypothetical protein